MTPVTLRKSYQNYKNQLSVVKIKETFKNSENFDLPKAITKDINKIIKSLKSNKATGPDTLFHLN